VTDVTAPFAPHRVTGQHPEGMTARVTHRTYCRICIAACGLEVDVEDGHALAVRGDAAHPLSAGYTCSKGRALPAMHHDTRRLDAPMLRTDGALRTTTWDVVLDDLRHRLDDIVREQGTESVGFFLGGGIYMDTAGYWCFRRISRRLDTAHIYSDTTIDSAAKYRAMELVAGTNSLMPHVDRDARLVLMLGTNPVVSHGQTPMFEDPVQRMRRTMANGEVWVIDPRVTESARLATRHLQIQPGTDHALLAFLVREVLADLANTDAVRMRVCNLARLAGAVEPFTLEVASTRTGLAADALRELLATVRRAGRLAVLTGTGVTMSRGGNVAEWLVWALLTLTDSFDRSGGMWFNPGYLARLEERDSLPGVGPSRPGPATLPEVTPLMGEWPAAVVPAEIEAGNLRALIVLGGNLVTALPDTERVLAALPRLDVLAVVDVAETPTTAVATHVLPTHAQLERPDIPLLNDLYNSERMMQYTPAVLPQHGGRRAGWWVLAQLGASLGIDVLPENADVDTLDDDAVLDLVGGTATLDGLRAADPPWLTAPSPVYEWVLPRLGDAPWDLAPVPLVDQLAAIAVTPTSTPTSMLTLIPRRMPKRFNGRDLGDDRPEVLVHPDDARAAGVADGDEVEVVSETGRLRLRARMTDTIPPGVVSISHGWVDANVNTLISSRDLDPLTGMPRSSGTAVSLRRGEP
jgi:anaerobic selenocysteine-containing dehydrogenase